MDAWSSMMHFISLYCVCVCVCVCVCSVGCSVAASRISSSSIHCVRERVCVCACVRVCVCAQINTAYHNY